LRRRFIARTGIDRFGAVYVLAGIVVLFTVWKGTTFFRWGTAQAIINESAISALAALSLLVPLSAGVFDLSIGYVIALSSVTVAWLVVSVHLSIGAAIAVALAMALAAGLLNGLVVVRLKIDSFIATLGTGSVLAAVNLLISGDESVTNNHLYSGLGRIVVASVGGVQVPAFIALAVALILWWLFEHTVTGRRLYATGFNEEASRLAGVRTQRLRFGGFLVSAVVAALAGILLTGQVGSGSPDVGPTYLLDAFAAAFLGATQIRKGRFNPFGTILAVLVLGTGTTGMTIAGASPWTLDMYIGVVLIVALILTKIERQPERSAAAQPLVDGVTSPPTSEPTVTGTQQ